MGDGQNKSGRRIQRRLLLRRSQASAIFGAPCKSKWRPAAWAQQAPPRRDKAGKARPTPSAKGGKYHMTQGLGATSSETCHAANMSCLELCCQNTRRLAIPVQDETPRGRVPKLAPNVTHSTAPAPWPRLKIKKCGGRRQANKNVCEATMVATAEKAMAPKRASNGRSWLFLGSLSSPPT